MPDTKHIRAGLTSAALGLCASDPPCHQCVSVARHVILEFFDSLPMAIVTSPLEMHLAIARDGAEA